MNTERTKTKNANMRIVLSVLFLTVLLVAVCFYAIKGINFSQYTERVANSNMLMEKICHHIETAVEFNWDRAHYIASQIEDEEFESLSEMLGYIAACEKNLENESYIKILPINDDGLCFVSDGTTFRWMSMPILNRKEDAMYVSDYQFASKTDMQMYYLIKLDKPLIVDGESFTHISVVCDMSELDNFFDVSNYGDESITFIIHNDGSQVYRQKKQTALSGVYNLLSALKNAQFNYDMDYETVVADIKGGVNDTVHARFEDNNYFISYYKLDILDWSAVLMVPEEYVGTGTRTFAKEIIQSILILMCSIFGIIMIISASLIYKINKKQKQINNQLIKVAQAEREANEAKTNFLSAMSHDIRTPMNAIVGMVEIATRRVTDPDYVKDCLGKIKLASDHLLTLINDVLDISKVESGKMKLNPVNFSLSECYANLIDMLAPQANYKNQKLIVSDHNFNNKYLYGDKLRINQIFINILSNAIKYTEENGTIWVDLQQQKLPGEDNLARIIYVVKDTGIGMSPEFMKNMYSTFSRADDSRTNNIQGSGLGLAICKQMVELMGGTINCESRIGEGTTFTIVIDIPVAQVKEEEQEFEGYEFNEQMLSRLNRLKILVAEDNDINWEITCTLLEMYGIYAYRAENGLICMQMLENAEEKQYDMVFMDVHMPVMDGLTTTRNLRKSQKEWVRNIPVIAMTADAFAEDVQECIEAGMNEHVSKPLDVQRLLEVIYQFV